MKRNERMTIRQKPVLIMCFVCIISGILMCTQGSDPTPPVKTVAILRPLPSGKDTFNLKDTIKIVTSRMIDFTSKVQIYYRIAGDTSRWEEIIEVMRHGSPLRFEGNTSKKKIDTMRWRPSDPNQTPKPVADKSVEFLAKDYSTDAFDQCGPFFIRK